MFATILHLAVYIYDLSLHVEWIMLLVFIMLQVHSSLNLKLYFKWTLLKTFHNNCTVCYPLLTCDHWLMDWHVFTNNYMYQIFSYISSMKDSTINWILTDYSLSCWLKWTLSKLLGNNISKENKTFLKRFSLKGLDCH